MAAQPVTAHDFRSIAQEYYQTGRFSDFTIVCNGKEHHVHRVLVAPHSKYFERAFSGPFKESAEGRIELLGDDAATVDRMIHYFYRLDYEYDATLSGAIVSAADRMLIDVRMYTVADKYDVPGLKTLALEKFRAMACKDAPPGFRFQHLREASYYELHKTELPESDFLLLRNALVDAWLVTGAASEFVTTLPCDFEEFMEAVPWLSVALNSRVLQSLQPLRMDQAHCRKCAYVCRAEAGVPTKCLMCEGDVPVEKGVVFESELFVPAPDGADLARGCGCAVCRLSV